MDPIYLDYNATTPIDPRVGEAMIPFIRKHYGNPSSSHVLGAATRQAVDRARKQVSEMLGCGVEEVIFTSGGSESNNYAIKGIAWARRDRGNHIITSAIEHPAVIEVCRYLEGQGFDITYLPVDSEGLVSVSDFEAAITPRTILVTIMYANNEVGTIQPIPEIAAIALARGIVVHTDCAQAVGKIPVRVEDLGVDMLSVAGHKLYAPKGIGALYVRSGIHLEKLVHGADHEMNWRAGTENVLEIVGLGEACRLVREELDDHIPQMAKLRDKLEDGLRDRYPDLRFNGHSYKRLPNTASISFRGIEANTILSELTGVAASAGAACHSDHVDVSAVLTAMKVPLEYAMGTVRFSVGRFTTEQEIDQAIIEISDVVDRLQPTSVCEVVSSDEEIKLTRFTHGLGCACKLRPQVLESVVSRLALPDDPNVLIGADTSDDAAVYKLDDATALVATVDFFTPIVDDPYEFGAIAAANSLSDVYAMGGRPLFALNVVGFPSNRLPVTVLEKILLGAQDKAREAGICIVGGHTVDDTEPKFGLAVTGVVAADHMVANRGARPGDLLVLTKPLGTGVMSTALKQGLLDETQRQRLVETMAGLNRGAAEAMQEVGVHAATDITGFGLCGHLLEMLKASNVGAEIHFDEMPFLPGVFELAASGVIPGGSRDNFEFTKPSLTYPESLSEIRQIVLNDAQTSGGLLIAVAAERCTDLLQALTANNVETQAVVGTIIEGTGIHVL